MALVPVRVTGTVRRPDQSVAKGQIDLDLMIPMHDGVGGYAAAITTPAPLVGGVYDATVYATDGPGVVPGNSLYRITEKYDGGLVVPWFATLPSSFAPQCSIADLLDARLMPSSIPEGSVGIDVWGAVWGPSGVEIGQVRLYTDTSTSGSPVAIPGASIIVPPQRRPYEVRFTGYTYNTAAGGAAFCDLYQDGVQVERVGGTSASASQLGGGGLKCFRAPPSTVDHIYSLYVSRLGGSAAHVFGASGASTYAIELAAFTC